MNNAKEYTFITTVAQTRTEAELVEANKRVQWFADPANPTPDELIAYGEMLKDSMATNSGGELIKEVGVVRVNIHHRRNVS